ncbi:Os04g0105400 [Oryza sativa Japonica Group]|uniref:Os04g0105400 protein n=1 Tax=Oryza sativa subsp. japonica TaxID=39947 RepID=Q0JFG4_ORYSJ|nr:Os04g0105400 [Oryza sativa Japonica Group]|eukprot:NP_001052009.2 Os04g0105400 [Oryza sativa Japonica Group]
MAVTAEVESSPAATGKLRYNSPLVQVSLIGLVCFCCPGMFNALTGLGGGGQLDHSTADNANTALYSCFAVFGVLGGAAHNLLGPRVTLLAGALTYPLYAASFLYYNHHPSRQAFPVTAGALLGVGAGLLWAAQGAIMTSYPPPSRRGSYISLFWCLFNLGGVLGGLLPFSLNYHRAADAASVNDATYIAFMAFMLLGAGLALLLLPASRIVRDDGSRATRMSYSSVSTEGWEILKLFANWRMLLVLPAAWASNFFYTYQFTTSMAASSPAAPRASTTSSTGAPRCSLPRPSATSSTSDSDPPAGGGGACAGSPPSPCSAPPSGRRPRQPRPVRRRQLGGEAHRFQGWAAVRGALPALLQLRIAGRHVPEPHLLDHRRPRQRHPNPQQICWIL